MGLRYDLVFPYMPRGKKGSINDTASLNWFSSILIPHTYSTSHIFIQLWYLNASASQIINHKNFHCYLKSQISADQCK